MSPDDQLLYESRTRSRQVVAAVVSGVMLMIATVVGLLGPHSVVSEQTINLIIEHRRATLDLVAAILNGIAEIAIGVTLFHLWRCAKARASRPLPFIPVALLIGVALAAITGIVYEVDIAHKAQLFVTHGQQTYGEANRLTTSTFLSSIQIGGQLASLLIAVAFVLISLQAMRVGLLPKLMGYVGLLSGALFLFPLTVVPVVQLFWFLALALLLYGRWPDGVPAAWLTGRAEPWPSGAEMRARRMAKAEASQDRRAARKRGDHRRAVSDAPSPQTDASGSGDGPGTPPAAAGPSHSAAKRKRKRRR